MYCKDFARVWSAIQRLVSRLVCLLWWFKAVAKATTGGYR